MVLSQCFQHTIVGFAQFRIILNNGNMYSVQVSKGKLLVKISMLGDLYSKCINYMEGKLVKRTILKAQKTVSNMIMIARSYLPK